MSGNVLTVLLACCTLLHATAKTNYPEEKGVIYLDGTSFYKVVGKSKPVVLSMDSLIPWGPSHDAFVEASRITSPSDVIWAVLPVHTGDDGNDESIKIAKKFDMADKKFPQILYFPRWIKDRDNVKFWGQAQDAESLIKLLEHQRVKITRIPGSEPPENKETETSKDMPENNETETSEDTEGEGRKEEL